MKPFRERLQEEKPLVADGAVGTLLFRRDLKPGRCPESVSLTDPQVLEEIAGEYLDAGAEIVQTNTFGASPIKLLPYHLAERTEELNRNAVRAVRNVVGDRAYVSGSCGPSGKILKPYGDADPDDLYASFRRQMESLIGAGVDVICIETMLDLAEVTLAVKAAKDVSPTMPVMATMTFNATPRGFHTIMGVNVERAAAGLQQAGADVVGSNCGNGIANMIVIARDFCRCSALPIIIQSNAGIPETRDGVPVYSETPQFMADQARELVELGVSIIGGCCGTTPEHTRALRRMVDALAKP